MERQTSMRLEGGHKDAFFQGTLMKKKLGEEDRPVQVLQRKLGLQSHGPKLVGPCHTF